MASPRTALVVCGGGKLHAEASPAWIPPDVVIAADGGADEAFVQGWSIDAVVGDMDSITPSGLARAEAEGARIQRHPKDKDRTDLELAIDEAVAIGVERVLVVGGGEGRADFVFADPLILAAERFSGVEIDGVFGHATMHVVRRERALTGTPGELISLVAVTGVARGVHTSGFRWNLNGEDLLPGSGRGLSNRFISAAAWIGINHGVVLAIRPGETADARV
jgi:thiamine pyrophosphokinase